ncbi:MAG: hypothetical protein FWE99_03840 [Bacteroidales bacterium]|nr:hypothetical protein [Bacteroidales bacterium]
MNMKRTTRIALALAGGLFLFGCEPIPTFESMAYIAAKDADGKDLTTLKFSGEGGVDTIYVETTLPRWVARPRSLDHIPYNHPKPDDQGYITTKNVDGETGWMTIKYRHAPGVNGTPFWLDVFNGIIEVTIEENTTGAPRSDAIFIWNDDIPVGYFTSIEVQVIQNFEP